ncbi:MAG: hypothetical protein AB9844_09325 [Clostridiaceae bacterium]
MNSKAFLKKIFKTGEGTTEEIIQFMLKNYFLKGYGLDDFEEDLILKYNKDERYSRDLRECLEDRLKKYSG